MSGFAVVHWLNENTASHVPLLDVHEQDRREGVISSVRFYGKRFPAKIVKITGKCSVRSCLSVCDFQNRCNV